MKNKCERGSTKFGVLVSDNSFAPVINCGDVLIGDLNADPKPGELIIILNNENKITDISKYNRFRERLELREAEQTDLGKDSIKSNLNWNLSGHTISRVVFHIKFI